MTDGEYTLTFIQKIYYLTLDEQHERQTRILADDSDLLRRAPTVTISSAISMLHRMRSRRSLEASFPEH